MTRVKILIAIILSAISLHSFAQKGESIIHFEDGTIKNWYIENIHHYKKDNKFNKAVAKIELTNEKSNGQIIYEYLELKKGKKRFLARIIYQGQKASLYSRHYLHNKKHKFYPNPSEASPSSPAGDVHYAKKANVKYCEEISREGFNAVYGNGFRKKATIFFSDCPELVNKIKKKEIKNSDKISAFEFYEGKCD